MKKNTITGKLRKSKKGGLVVFFKVNNIKKYLYVNGFNQVRRRETNDRRERGNCRKKVLEKMTHKKIQGMSGEVRFAFKQKNFLHFNRRDSKVCG